MPDCNTDSRSTAGIHQFNPAHTFPLSVLVEVVNGHEAPLVWVPWRVQHQPERHLPRGHCCIVPSSIKPRTETR